MLDSDMKVVNTTLTELVYPEHSVPVPIKSAVTQKLFKAFNWTKYDGKYKCILKASEHPCLLQQRHGDDGMSSLHVLFSMGHVALFYVKENVR